MYTQKQTHYVCKYMHAHMDKYAQFWWGRKIFTTHIIVIICSRIIICSLPLIRAVHELMPCKVTFEPTAEVAHVTMVGLLSCVFPFMFTQGLCHRTEELAETALSDWPITDVALNVSNEAPLHLELLGTEFAPEIKLKHIIYQQVDCSANYWQNKAVQLIIFKYNYQSC